MRKALREIKDMQNKAERAKERYGVDGHAGW
jgi:hypothetical protein